MSSNVPVRLQWRLFHSFSQSLQEIPFTGLSSHNHIIRRWIAQEWIILHHSSSWVFCETSVRVFCFSYRIHKFYSKQPPPLSFNGPNWNVLHCINTHERWSLNEAFCDDGQCEVSHFLCDNLFSGTLYSNCVPGEGITGAPCGQSRGYSITLICAAISPAAREHDVTTNQ
jgi:hypothetical protein